jgi:two-component system, cell cycle sensor histidine kinase and response regulator CckA
MSTKSEPTVRQRDRKAPRVLVADDEVSILRFATRVLTGAGYEVVTATSGADALVTVERDGPFDLFVIDVVMPGMRGDELARRLRQSDPNANILYFTAYPDRLFEDRELLWAHEWFVEKPVTTKGLLEAVSLAVFGHTQGPAVG